MRLNLLTFVATNRLLQPGCGLAFKDSDAGADVDLVSKWCGIPLSFAMRIIAIEQSKLLLDSGVDADGQYLKG